MVHSDLSPYNVLWNGHEHRIIDFPQAIDPRFNSSAQRLLVLDAAPTLFAVSGEGAVSALPLNTHPRPENSSEARP